jgi:hypothetical protein
MSNSYPHHISTKSTVSRREFIKVMGLATGSAPLFLNQFSGLLAQTEKIKVYKVMNGDCFEGI